MRARDIMTVDVVTVAADAQVSEVARVLLRHRISALPVVGEDGRLVGIVSEGDLLRRAETGTERHRSWWLALLATPEDAAREYVSTHGQRVGDVISRDVVTVREDTAVTQAIRATGVSSPAHVNVIVTGGVVHLWGLVHSEQERRALQIAAENTPDVRGVAVHLSQVPIGAWGE